MPEQHYPYFLAGQPAGGERELPVVNKYSGETVGRVALADATAVETAIAAAAAAADECRRLPAYARADVLQHVARRLAERREELARILAVEVGKPLRDARGEIGRAIDTFHFAAGEALRLRGEYLPLDISPRAAGYEGICRRFAVGPCALIVPFNFPVNLAAHKIAPAVAAGCPFVLKPASLTPISALLLGELLAETPWPRAGFSILPCGREAADPLVTDERIRLLSFTGSPAVGWELKRRAGRKKVVLELGGNAACVIAPDADLDYALPRVIMGAFCQSGQSCISVQRLLVHESIYADLVPRLVEAAQGLRGGDPLEEETFLGPLITEAEARRVESWVNAAAARGARVLCGGRRHGPMYEATLVEGVPDDEPLASDEVFGPVAVVEPYASFEEACRRVNASRYGLQAGVFTGDLHAAFYAFRELEVGGVVINDVPSFRVDHMPYGGVKDSGFGREGIRYAIEEMTELRLLVLNRAGERPGSAGRIVSRGDAGGPIRLQ